MTARELAALHRIAAGARGAAADRDADADEP